MTNRIDRPDPSPDFYRRRYLLVIRRKVFPPIQLLWAEDHFEARVTAKEMILLDPVVVSIRIFRPALLDKSAPTGVHSTSRLLKPSA